MKRLLYIIGFLVILVVLMTAVFFPFFKSSPELHTQNNLAKLQTWELDFGHNIPLDSALHMASIRFAEMVDQKSNGRVKINVHPGQKLGNDHKMVELARRGELDIILTPTAKMSVASPSIQYADLPFFFPSRQDVYDMLDGEPGKMLLEDLHEIGLVGVTFWGNGFKHFTANSPILTPKDFLGKNIRVMKSRIIMDQFKSFGANSILIDFHSTRQALKDGVVDGQENPLVAIVTMGFHEVQSDLTLSEHAYLGYVFSISAKTFEKLPLDIRKILMESALEITPWEREQTDEKERKFLEIIKQAGVNVHTLEESERKKFEKLVSHIPKQYEEIIGCDVISKTKELLYEKYGALSESNGQIVIGLNADLSTDAKTAGLAIKRGIELAIDEINSKGGVLGKKLLLIAKDHRSIASKGVENNKVFIEQGDTVAVLSGLHSPVVLHEIKSMTEAGMPFLIPWAAASGITENNFKDNSIFRISANDRFAARFIAKYALKKHSKPAIIVENSAWGRGNLEKMRAYLQEQGKDFNVELIFNRGQDNFDDEFKKIMDSGADSLIMVSNSMEGGTILNKMATYEKTLPIISHWGIIGGPFFKDNKQALNKVDLSFFQTFSFLKNKHPKSQALAKKYLEDYAIKSIEDIQAPAGVAQAYDLVQLLALAIQKAATTERSKVREALEKLPSYQGAVKYYEKAFSVDNHDALGVDDYYIARFSPDGYIVPVGSK